MRNFPRRHLRRSACAAVLAPALLAGCAAAPLSGPFLSGSRQQEQEIESHVAATDSTVPTPKEVALRKALAESAPTQEQALASVLDQLEEIRAIDPEAERQLMADLKQVKPEDYEMVVDTFRTALAYRQQLAHRRLQTASEATAAERQATTRLASHADGRTRPSAPPLAQPPVTQLPPSARRPEQQPERLPAAAIVASDAVVQPASYETAAPAPVQPATASAAVTRPAQGGQLLEPIEPAATPAIAEHAAPGRDEPVVRALTAAADAGQPAALLAPSDWRAQLNSSIAHLERSVAAKPTTVAELHDHMRLRTLQLLAGNDEGAYRPIPGASPAQQDYWSKQLFAMAAYLNASQLDDKQRAVAALGSLDEARAKLSELATLQIRNLSFVDSVDGFGAYAPRKATVFNPGQKVTVYAEVENFTSNSAEDGYHTSLGTSYQVLDKTGRRVDGKQFPEVKDACRNRRRDFHMQYQFALPTKIYPGPYDLEITITDHNSGKIAQSTVPFEIAGEQ